MRAEVGRDAMVGGTELFGAGTLNGRWMAVRWLVDGLWHWQQILCQTHMFFRFYQPRETPTKA